jgi:LDH2 family malate/lactate/ureidoglycolate dehydrogenase
MYVCLHCRTLYRDHVTLLQADDLRAFCRQLSAAAGASRIASDLVADSLVASNLRGVDSHGVSLLPYYLAQWKSADVDIRATGRIAAETGACLTFDGENAIGQLVAATCCDEAARLADTYGVGIVTARESNHFGAAGYWAKRISAERRIGMVLCNASPLVPPWQGREGRLGTNPICMAVPGGEEPAWLLDMATTTVAANKIFKAFNNQTPSIPAGWAMDKEGVPTTSTDEAYHGLLMPLGGYKGSGLAVMVEILCAVLSASAIGTELGGIRFPGKPVRVGQFYLAIDVARFMPLDEFGSRMDKLIRMLRSTAPAKGYQEVLVANDPERRVEAQRMQTGIPIDPGTWERLCKSATELKVPLPL